MSTIKLINEAHEKGILVVYLTSSSGNFNCDARRLTALQSRIPSQIVDPDMEYFAPFQQHFGLLDLGLREPRYMDYLREDVPYMFCTFKVFNGRSGVIERKQKAPPNGMAPTRTQHNLYVQKVCTYSMCQRGGMV